MLWLVALILGWLLVEGQPSAGGYWTEPHLLSVHQAHFSWGLLLAGLAICLWGAGKRTLSWGFLGVVALGAWLPSLLLDGPYFQIGPGLAALLMVLMGVYLHLRASKDQVEEGQFEAIPISKIDAGALALGGFGLAFALHGLARILARMGNGMPGDTSITLAVLTSLVGIGAFAFGRPIGPLASRRNKVHGFVWIATMLGVFAALRAEQTLGTSQGLRSLMRRFHLDLSHTGTTPGDILTSVSVLIMPAFAMGTLVVCLRDARRVSWVVLGAALGTFCTPSSLTWQGLPGSELQPSIRLILWGMALLAGTGPLVWWGQNRKVGAGLAAACGIALVIFLPRSPILIPKPWQRTQVEPVWQLETIQGQLTVTSDGMGAYQALLDQQPLTADAEHARLHDRCIAFSMGWLPQETRQKARVLLIGVLTPQISNRLQGLGATRIDRLTPFGTLATQACERALAGGKSVTDSLGDPIDALEASERLERGLYDLVLALPTQGASAPQPDLDGPNGTLTVIWNSLEGLQGTRSSSADHVLCSDGLSRFAIAYKSKGPSSQEGTIGPKRATLSSGAHGISRWKWHGLRSWDRAPLALAQSMDSFAQEADDSDALLFRTLSDLFKAQEHSSPFETEFQGFELSQNHVDGLAAALKAGPSTPFYLEIAGGLARVLVGKRDVGTILRVLPDLSEAMGRPYELERSLARAELESLDPGAAALRLQRLRRTWPNENSLLEELGAALDQSEQPALAAEIWGTLRGMHPGEWPFEKAWTLSLVRAGDARSPAALAAALRSHPEDQDLLAVSQSGPLPPIEKGFVPTDGRHDDHDDHH